MYIHGEFLDRQGRTVAVYIVTGADYTDEIIIGETSDALLQFTDSPVEIECNVNDCFDHIISHTATIHVQTRAYIDGLFCASPFDAVVNITRDGECLFMGFIEPLVYSQSFNEVYDDLDISCIDILGALQYLNYGGVGLNGVSYETMAETVGRVCLFDVITGQLSTLAAKAMTSAVTASTLYYDGRLLFTEGGAGVFRNAIFHDTLFYGDSESDIWTYEKVTDEFLKYCNLHLEQTGATFVAFTWEGIRAGYSDWQTYDLAGTGSSSLPSISAVTFTKDNVADCDTSISIVEPYSQIALTCNIEDSSTFVGSMLDEDTLYSGYASAQMYMREIVEEDEALLTSVANTDDTSVTLWDAWLAFAAMVLDYSSLYATAAATGATRRASSAYATDAWWQDWYIKTMVSTTWNTAPAAFTSDGDLRSAECQSVIDDATAGSGAMISALHSCMQYPGAAFFLQIGAETKTYLNSSTATVSTRDDETFLVFNIGGNGIQSYFTYSSNEYVPYPLASTFAYMPMAGLAQTVEGAFAPDDSTITNYIVISGTLRMVSYKKTANDLSTAELHSELFARYGTDDDTCYLTEAEYDTDGYSPRYTRRMYGDDGSWKSITDKTAVNPPTDEYTSNNVTMTSGTRAEAMGRTYQPYNSDDAAHVKVIGCFLSVGSKCVNETSDGVYEWVEFDDSDMDAAARAYHFFIKVQVDDETDMLDNDLSIANEVTTSMNIDGEGLAIPVSYDDALEGDVKFYFLAPCNIIMAAQSASDEDDTTSYYNYAGSDFLEDSEDWAGSTYSETGAVCLLPATDSIMISDFEINIYSDNGGVEESSLLTTSNDVVYQSDTAETYINRKDDIDFALCSGLTVAEANALGVLTTVNKSTVRDADGSAILTCYDSVRGVEAKAEAFYIDSYYNECHEAQVEMKQTVIDDGGVNVMNAYTHPAIDKTFHVMGISRSLLEGEATLTLKTNNDD